MGLRIVDIIDGLLKLFCKNKLVVLYSNNNKSLTKSKHINIKFLVVKERVQSRQLPIKHMRTNFMIMNLLTKGVLFKMFHEHVAHTDVMSSDDVQF